MRCSRMLVHSSWLALWTFALASSGVLAATNPIVLQPTATLEISFGQITVASTSTRVDFLAAADALSDRDSWEILLDGSPIRIENVVLNVAERTVTLNIPPRALRVSDSEDIPDGTLKVRYKPLQMGLSVPTGPRKSSSTRGWLDGCFAYSPTAEKKKADVDISGGLQAGYDAKPQYFWSVKAKCALLGSRYGLGEFGPSFTGEASQQRNADPDSLKAAITYRKLKSSSTKPTGWEVVADALSYEFERNLKKEAVIDDGKPVQQQFLAKNSNLMWTGIVRYVYGYPSLNWTLGLAGFEAGKSLSRTVKKTSSSEESQRITRMLFDFDAYKGVFRRNGTRALTLHAHHTLRLPFVQEPYLRASENNGKMYLTSKPRHWTLVELTVHLSKGAGINIQYKRGSLPPTFEFVNHQLTVGFNLLLKHS